MLVVPQDPVARSFEDRVADRLNPAAAAALSKVNANTGGSLEKAWVAGGFIPAFAQGGYHSGGLRLVGEQGPELEATGSSEVLQCDPNCKYVEPVLSHPRRVLSSR